MRWLSAVAVLLLVSPLGACKQDVGCLAGDDDECQPPTACQALEYACAEDSLSIGRVEAVSDRPRGDDALASEGDVVLQNDRLTLVIDDIDHPHHIAPTGGNILDLSPRGGPDNLNQTYQASGILPDDAVAYHALELIDESPEFVAVIARGKLEGRPKMSAVTRYELRPCEPGVRVRTELFHGGEDPRTVFLSDAWFWGDREVTPFAPGPGLGFTHPELSLLEIEDAFRSFPFIAAQSHVTGAKNSSVAVVPCDRKQLDGFNTSTVSAVGLASKILLPGDALAWERFLVVGEGDGVAPAVDRALQAREQLFGDPFVAIRGRTVGSDGVPVGGDEREVSLIVYEGDDDIESREPWTEIVPDVDGHFEAWVPANRALRMQTHVLGRARGEAIELETDDGNVELGEITVEATASVFVRLRDQNGSPVAGEVVLSPTDPEERESLLGSIHGQFENEDCVPYLGPVHGGSPSCNRVLLGLNGQKTVRVPAGSFWVYGTAGPFHTLDRQMIDVDPGDQLVVDLQVERLDVLPDGVLSGDFHVHAGASYDSSLPEIDRARSFLATDVDVIAATDHDVVSSYEQAIATLGIEDRVAVMNGIETTGLILFFKPPGAEFPKTIGHYNFWPLQRDPLAPRNGAPQDDLLMPGELFDEMVPLLVGDGVVQSNHPYSPLKFGRDEGFLQTVEYDPRDAIPESPDDTPGGFLIQEPGGGFSNIAYDVQEVMNGPKQEEFLQYRAGWFSFLSQGLLRGGTANSDSHTLSVNVLGYPRNLVFGGHSVQDFDPDAFNRSVKNGELVGTNGPVVLASLEGADGEDHGPALVGVEPAANAMLSIEVRAAPWIPVEEIRVFVNGRLAWSVDGDALVHPADAFGTDDVVRFADAVALSELLADVEGDAWIVVEAGLPQYVAEDLDDDGLPDTTDNDGDGDIDANDLEGEFEEEPFTEPARPSSEDDSRYHLDVIAPGTWPTAYTNPLLVDRDGDGWEAPGL